MIGNKISKMFILFIKQRAINLAISFLLLISLAISQPQSCITLKSLQVCYTNATKQFHFTKCLASQCIQYSSQRDQCLNFTLQSYSELDCAKKICNKNTLVQCLVTSNDKDNSQKDENDRLLKIYIGSAGSFAFLVIFLFCCRRARAKLRVTQNQSIVSNANANSNVLIQSLQSLVHNQTATITHHVNENHSTVNFDTIEFIKTNYLKRSRKTLKTITSSFLSSFVPEEDSKIEQQIKNFDQGLNEKICCICLSSEKIDCKTQCGHFYHLKCLAEWIQRKLECPQCRSKKFAPIKAF